MAYFFGAETLEKRFNDVGHTLDTGDYFRIKATYTSFKVLGDYPIFGVGAGLYGGAVADKFESPYHNYYHTFEGFRGLQSNTIDTFWPHAWAELGIVGFILFITILVKILRKLYNLVPLLGDIPRILFLMIIASLFISEFSMALESAFVNVLAFLLAGSVINKPESVFGNR